MRHAQRHRKSLSRAQHGIGNASVAAGGVEQDFAGSELAIAAAFGDDVGGGAVFHGATGVVPFGLAQKCHAGKMRGKAIKAQQRSVADAVQQTLARAHHLASGRMMRRESRDRLAEL